MLIFFFNLFQRSDDNKNLNTDITLSTNGKKYTLTNDVTISETNPAFDLKVTYPENKISRISAKFNRISPEQFNGDINIANIKDFSLEASGEANLESVENFLIKIKVNSEKLQWKNVNIEILNKPTKSGNRVQFSAKSGATNLLSGSTSFESKEEAGKLIVQGSGEVQVKDNKKKASFKFIRKNLDAVKDNEKGLEITLDGSLGSKKVVGELIISDKQLHFRKQYCEDNQNCAHIDVTSKHTSVELSKYNHVLEVSVDLRKVGINNEFGLKSVYDRNDLDIVHDISLYFKAKEKMAYEYKFYASPKKAGVQLVLPKRIIAIEGVANVDMKNAPKNGKAEASLTIYLNKKKQPNDKLSISVSSDIDIDDVKKYASANGQIKVTHPALEKDLILSGSANVDKNSRTAQFNADIDIFAKKQQKFVVVGKVVCSPAGEKGFNITSDVSIESKGQNIHIQIADHAAATSNGISAGHKVDITNGGKSKQAIALLVINKQQVEVLLQSWHLAEPFHIDAKISLDKKNLVAKSTVNVLGLTHLVQELEIKDLNTIIFSQYSKESPNDKLSGVAGFIPGQVAEIKLDNVKGGAKKPLAHATLRLDDAHFLQSDYGANADNIKAYLELVRGEVSALSDAVKKAVVKAESEAKVDVNQLKEQIKKAMPNFKPIVEDYKNQLAQLRQEIISDKQLQEMEELL